MRVKREERKEDVCLKCSDFTTICPYTGDRDHVEVIEITYKPLGKYLIDEKRLKEYISNKLEGSKVPMEAVPLKILVDCMTYNKDWLKEGREKTITINAHFSKKSGARMIINMKFKRRWA